MSKIRHILGKAAPHIARMGLLVVAMVIVVGEIAPPVQAINNYGPDGADFSAYDRVYMVVSEGGGTGLLAKKSKVFAYASAGGGGNQTIRITLVGGDHCYDGNSGALGIDSSSPFQTNGSDTTFKFSTPTGTEVVHNNAVRSTPDSTSPSGCNTDYQDFYVPVNDGDRPSVESGLHGYYKIAVDAEMFNNGVNAFKVILQDGGILSFTDSAGDRFALQQRVDRNWVRSDFNVYFATPCNSGDIVHKDLNWFDADQGAYGQNTSTFGYRLYQRARGTNNGWTQIDQNTNVGGEGFPGNAGYDFYRNQEYRWEWYGVSPSNGIQFQVPFDSAYAAVGCEGADFALTPKISVNPLIVSPATSLIGVTAWVDKTGSTNSFSDEEWRVTRLIVPPGGNLSNNGVASEPCSQFGGYAAGRCNTVWGASNQTFTNNSTTLTNNWGDGVDSTLQPGTKICYVTSVSKGSTVAPTWLHSNVVCSQVLQIPFTYILGNDLRVGSGFNLSQNNASSIFGYVTSKGGSWTEYGVLAPGAVSGMASQAGALNGSSSSQGSWSNLTFANTGVLSCGTPYGCFASAASMGTIPNVSTFATNAALTGIEKRNKGAGNVSISSEFASGIYDPNNFKASVVLYTTGTVTIDRDIKYTTDTLTDTSQIPQLIIIAGNINITSNVKQADAWLVSTGTVNTCSDVAQANLRTTNCNDSLRINGPIMANQLLLDRTYYDQAKTHAAEEVNLRGDAYVWANQLSRTNGSWQTTYTTDLPPRY